jgi:tetratricopeptide (TPR) repeat protein
VRIFAGDTVPGLALVAPALPRPWVLPDGVGSRHRNRLVRLLHTALRATQPGLRLGELRWGERDLVARGRMSLPSEILIRWRIDFLPGLERREVMRECERLGPRLAVFDFGPGRGEQLLAWLGPFKLEVLRRLTDALLDHPPVKPVEEVVDVLNELAERLQSPIDLIDAAETMLEQIALGQAVSGARAEACARVLVARFEDVDEEHDGTDVLHALAALAEGKELTGDTRALLEAVGLIEPGTARPLPLAELVREDEVHRRAQRLVATQFSLRELAPGLDIDVDIPMTMVSPSVTRAIAQHPGPALTVPTLSLPAIDLQPVLAASGSPSSPRAAMLQRAWAHLVQGDRDVAAKLVIEEMREQHVVAWTPPEAAQAGRILSVAAINAETSSQSLLASAWAEASASAFERAGQYEQASGMYLMAAHTALEDGDAARAIAICTLQGTHMDRLAPQQQAKVHRILGDAYVALDRLAEAEAAYEQELALAEPIGDLSQQLPVHLALGDIQLKQDRPDAARRSYRRAIKLSRELEDREAEARGRLGLGRAFFALHEFKRSARTLSAALKLWPADNLSGKAEVYASLAEALMHLGGWRASLQFLRRALTLFQETHDWEGQARVLEELGHTCLELHEFGGARAAFESLLAGSQKHEDTYSEILALASMSEVLCWLGDVEGARKLAELAIERAAQVSSFAAEVVARRALARIHVWTGELDAAAVVYAHVLDHAPEAHDTRDFVLLMQLELLALAIACGDQPRDLLEECQRLAEAQEHNYAKPLVDILAAALPLPEELEAGRATWVHAAEDLEGRGRHTEAALTRAMVAVANGELLDQVADKLTERLGAIHPLPERVRAAASPTEAIRAIIAFL